MGTYDFYGKLINEDIDDVVDILLQDFDKVQMVDEKIDDGCTDGGEDDYVMMRSFDVVKGDEVWYVRCYFGNYNREIGHVYYVRQS